MLRAAVIDDEPLARARLKRLLTAQDVLVVAEGENGQHAVDIVMEQPIDLLFIDINMPVMNGLQAVNQIDATCDRAPAIVFCTAYDQYAVEAFRTNAVAYLLKPFDLEQLRAALNKARSLSKLQVQSLTQQQEIGPTIALHYEGAIQNVPLAKISYFYSTDKNVFAVLTNTQSVLIDKTLKQLETLFGNEVIRIHRSFVVNRGELVQLLRTDGRVEVRLKSGDATLTVSRRHITQVKKCFI
ncbi:DNA-binding response regulator [Arenicella chitinivorans]|uniref:DNA-binding response regulator n=1 Tax=Arenicella chitinivorans TaxID=1329800 RepID=A0A918VLL3_9GAMM|nr:LytTR family DNA-binding domain-containing protein [Arenicella chitinivorans]GHA07283.1 DNA-binding response regulator [Arenicella chitinivorans]